ncbi:AsmA-like C-terminal domain-containing protein [Telmatospirillum sp. J64-1]|uniref:YhdP family protein n=1 Tax=Telmatospirillum sp. J64-1 TaxID=2502183 RepID=UPI00115C5398|nr:AsmA-like C-terminal domain-containing protein [Telmatospirillum sp. J64-1]
MVHEGVARLFRLLGALLAVLLLTLPILAWRLAQAPLTVDFLNPYISEALSAADGSVRVELDSTVLAWGGAQRALSVRALNVRALDSRGRRMVSLPELALTLSGPALLRGELAPRSIELSNMRIRLVREADGRFRWLPGQLPEGEEVDEADASGALLTMIAAELAAPLGSGMAGDLERLRIADTDLTLIDRAQGIRWHVTDTDIILQRDEDGVVAEVSGRLGVEGEESAISVIASYSRNDDSIEGETAFQAIRPARLALLNETLQPLTALDLPLDGLLSWQGNLKSGLESLRAHVQGGEGHLRLDEPLGLTYPIAALSLHADLSEGLTRLELPELFVDLGGPTLLVEALAEEVEGRALVKADAMLRDVAVDMLPRLWPETAGRQAREWVLRNLENGHVPEATATLSATVPLDAPEETMIDALNGTIQAQGVTVHYLRPMPPVLDARAAITFDQKSFDIHAQGGGVQGLSLRNGTIRLLDLHTKDPHADINLEIAGPVPSALGLIDSEPLGYARQLGIRPAQTRGDSVTKLHLAFPLEADLKLDDIGVKAEARVSNIRLPKVLMDLDLSGGTLDLTVDAKGMDVAGSVVLGTIPAELNWRENFTKGEFRSRYRLKAPRVTQEQRASLGLDSVPFIAPWIDGPVAAEVEAVTRDGGHARIEVKADLAAAAMELPGLGWEKDAGTPGSATAVVEVRGQHLHAVPHFSVDSAGLQAEGLVSFTQGRIERVDFLSLRYGRNDVAGWIGFQPGEALEISLRGPAFDAEPLLSDRRSVAAAEGGKDKDESLPPMTIRAELGQMWVSAVGSLDNVVARLERDDKDWRLVRLDGWVTPKDSVQMELAPNLTGRQVTVTSDNAGAVLRAFNLFDNIMGGKMTIQASFDDSDPRQPLSGTASISDYSVVRAPVLARLLSVAAVTGIVDELRGEGISFSTAEAPFTFVDGVLQLHDAHAYGASLGLTAQGQLDLKGGVMALEGTIVPMYALNSALGNIPILGQLLTGTEKGGGIFAATYRMTGPSSDPSISVNPLAALAPGFLRRLFGFTGDVPVVE